MMELPRLACTEDAIRFGQFITRDQFVFLSGARAALQNEFEQDMALVAKLATPELKERWLNHAAVLGTKIQLLREALEAAPDLILCSLAPLNFPHDGQPMTAAPIPEETIARENSSTR